MAETGMIAPPPDPSPRVAHVITGLDGGGAERFMVDLLPRLAPPERTAVWSIQKPGVHAPALRERGYPPHTLGAWRGWPPGPLALGRFRRWTRAWKPEVVCGWMYHGNLAATWIARQAGLGRVPGLVWGIHQTPAGPGREKWLTRLVIGWGRRHSARPGAIVYASGASREAHRALGYDDRRARVIHNGFDLSALRPAGDGQRRAVRRELGLPPEARVVLRVARADPMKDYPSLLESFALLLRRTPDAWLVAAGEGVGPEAPFARQWRRREPAAAARVRWLGWRGDVPRLAAAADVAVSSSSMKESFPLVLGEAMGCGTPCVATDVGDSARLVGDTGRVVPPRQAGPLADALAAMLSLSLESLRAMGARARQRIEALFSLETAARLYRQALREAADPAPGHGGT